MKSQTCCFTGHRRIPKDQCDGLSHRLDAVIEEMIGKGYRYFRAGGAQGFDTMAALSVLKFREKYPKIKLILVLPYVKQPERWPQGDQKVYYDIMERADKVEYVSQEHTRKCMFKRNRSLVDYSSACISYLTEDSGGTAYTVDYARKKGLDVINLADAVPQWQGKNNQFT